MIGISSVIIVYGAGEGIRSLLNDQLESFGTNIIQAEIKVPNNKKGTANDSQSATALASGVQVTSMKLVDLEDMKKLPNVSDGYAAILGQEKISYGNDSRKAFTYGVSASFLNIDKSEIEFGTFFTEEDDKTLAPVVILGSAMKEKLFGESEAIGKSIYLRRDKFKVIGVMKKKGAVMGMDFDNFVYVPIRTLQKKVMGIDHVMFIIGKLRDNSLSGDTAAQIRALLRVNHDITNPDRDDFRVSTMDDMMDMLNTVMNALTYLLLSIVVISLIVGGVGILNIMYVIVSERTMEIGLRKAVGASYADIMTQFLVEAVLITTLGAIIGIILGVIISWLIYLGATAFGFNWTFYIPLKAFIVSLIFAFVCGVSFGVYPARKAAKMDPIEALRRE
jgi:putative ABC transport system permease protein